MAYQTPITIRAALDGIWKNQFVLPAIQREFVWRPEQIARLFDSIMQGFPVGSFGEVTHRGTDLSAFFIYRALRQWVKPGGTSFVKQLSSSCSSSTSSASPGSLFSRTTITVGRLIPRNVERPRPSRSPPP
jgi:hypothetical protein